jgi:putative SOS response-associated peptidase YedK
MRPPPPGSIVTWRVGRAVGNVKNNGAELLAAA